MPKRSRDGLRATILHGLWRGVLLGLTFASLQTVAGPTPTLELWIGSDKGYRAAAEIGRRYQLASGRRVIVRHFDDLPVAFELAAREGHGPDILLWAHDRFGEWAERGWIVPVEPSPAFVRQIAPFTWSALRIGSNLYGYPIAVETVALLYNRALINAPPADFEQLFDIAPVLHQQGVAPIAWDYRNTYFSWGLFSANGGYAFAQHPSGFDPDDTGIDQQGSIAGGHLLQRMLRQRVLDGSLTGLQALNAFAEGRVAMTINGPWVWGKLEQRGIDFGVAALPHVQGGRAKPFVGVWAAAVTRFAAEPQWAAEFLEQYLLSSEGLRLLNADHPLGAVAHQQLMGELAADHRVDQTFLNAVQGQMMPNLPRMGQFWQQMGAALERMTHAEQNPQTALQQAAEVIRGDRGQ